MYVYLLFIYEKSDPSTLPSGTPREIYLFFSDYFDHLLSIT